MEKNLRRGLSCPTAPHAFVASHLRVIAATIVLVVLFRFEWMRTLSRRCSAAVPAPDPDEARTLQQVLRERLRRTVRLRGRGRLRRPRVAFTLADDPLTSRPRIADVRRATPAWRSPGCTGCS
jgi:hypothetical protein